MTNKKSRQRTKKSEDFPVGHLSSGRGTEVASSVYSIDIPDGAEGFRIYPTTNAIRFAVDADPSTEGGFTVLSSGAIAKPGAWETRLLQAGSSTVRVLATTSTIVDVEFF